MKISISRSLSPPHTSHLILDNIYKDRKGDLHLFKKHIHFGVGGISCLFFTGYNSVIELS